MPRLFDPAENIFCQQRRLAKSHKRGPAGDFRVIAIFVA
jgi:hypothetical protein